MHDQFYYIFDAYMNLLLYSWDWGFWKKKKKSLLLLTSSVREELLADGMHVVPSSQQHILDRPLRHLQSIMHQVSSALWPASSWSKLPWGPFTTWASARDGRSTSGQLIRSCSCPNWPQSWLAPSLQLWRCSRELGVVER